MRGRLVRILLMSALALSLPLGLAGCGATAPSRCVCPALPPLPASFQRSSVSALDRTHQDFKDFTSAN